MTYIRVSLSIIFILISTNTYSQSKFIRSVEAKYAGLSDLTLNFKQTTYVAAMEQSISKVGMAKFQNPKKFNIEYTGAAGRMYVSDGKKLWYYLKGDTQVNVMQLSAKFISPEALSILGGFGSLFEHFAVSELSAAELKALAITQSNLKWLKLVPNNEDSSFQYYLMGFDIKTLLVNELVMLSKSENKTTYHLNSIQTNQGLTPETFTFKKDGVKEVKRERLE